MDLSEPTVILPASIRWKIMKDELEELIDAAHDLYGVYSIYEVMTWKIRPPPSSEWWRFTARQIGIGCNDILISST